MKTTIKALKKYYNCYYVGYCDLSYLLQYKTPIYYNSGVYGWNFDVYFVGNNTVICTGYRSMPGKRLDFDITRAYNEKARQIVNDHTMSYDQKSIILDNLLDEYMKEVII